LTEFEQIFTTDGLWGKYERVEFWDQKIKGQAHGGVKYAPRCTSWSCSCHMLVEA